MKNQWLLLYIGLVLPWSQPVMGQKIDRADLAMAYLQVDALFQTSQYTDEEIEQYNRAFDQASLQFFSGDAVQTWSALRRLIIQMSPASREDPEAPVVMNMTGFVDPPVWNIHDHSSQPILYLTGISKVELADQAEVKFTARLRNLNNGRTVIASASIILPMEPAETLTVPLTIEGSETFVGTYEVFLRTRKGTMPYLCRWFVTSESLDRKAVENDRLLSEMKPDNEELAGAVATCRDRNGLLKDRPGRENSAEFLLPLTDLSESITDELSALIDGKNPYHDKRGEMWRRLRVGDVDLPLRIYAPATMPDPAPLIIALHGAGGDENMMMDGYGAGQIKALAEKHGFVVASPSATLFITNPIFFEELTRQLARDYRIDPDRIYVLGHSTGATGAISLAGFRSDKLAGVACLAGIGEFPATQHKVPTLVIAGALDPLIPRERIDAAVAAAKAANLPVELRVMERFGHTLLVNRALPEAIEWLLQRKRGTPLESTALPQHPEVTNTAPAK